MSSESGVHLQKALALARARRFGVLVTHLAQQREYPFGSLVNYVLDDANRPVFLFSRLAVHTRNIAANARASLFVFAAETELETVSAARLNLMGDVEPVSGTERDQLRAAYLMRHPDAAQYADFGDFSFYRLIVSGAYFVGGFGEMGWISGW